MSITRGPIVPPSTGSSTDFPVELSVNVIVPVTILFPSIDPPLFAVLAGGCQLRPENRLLARDWQTRARSLPLPRQHQRSDRGSPLDRAPPSPRKYRETPPTR